MVTTLAQRITVLRCAERVCRDQADRLALRTFEPVASELAAETADDLARWRCELEAERGRTRRQPMKRTGRIDPSPSARTT